MFFSIALFLTVIVCTCFLMGVTPPRDPLASDPTPAPVIAEFDWDAAIKQQMALDATLFAQDPTAFWNDPMRYGGIQFPQPKARDQFDNVPLFYGFVRVPGQTVVQRIDVQPIDFSKFSDAELEKIGHVSNAAWPTPR